MGGLMVGDGVLSLSRALFSVVSVKKVEKPPSRLLFFRFYKTLRRGTGLKGLCLSPMGFLKGYKV
ncbi:hypothetical protein [Bartonella florencae]|uniref:hypothetical protein n=1 Tax=Bartonella florencae TaxID=928210 RepID=UPI000305453F|nr:hypothetical protein [Bartonella florencae]